MFSAIRSSRFLGKSIAAALLLAYVSVMAGIPLPTIKRSHKSDELFPCASNGCGCDSAERCWNGCCCHTLAQRLAWAKDHNVRPPDFALDEARTAGMDTSAWDGPLKLVKATVAVKSCCAAKKHAIAPSCCSKKLAAAPGCCSSHGKPRSNDDTTRNIVGWRALACHGQSLNWLTAVPTLVTVELELADQLPLVAWLGPHSSDIAAGVTDVPTPPPPERA